MTTDQNKSPPSSPHVYTAIAAIAADLAKEGISKDRQNQQQGYKFRGIDDVYNALAPVLARHSLVILPQVLERQVVERQTQKGGTLFYVTLKVQYDFVSAVDGSKHSIVTYGEAMDSADKATNKAMSASYKYGCMLTFCIPTEGDNDADATTHEPAPKQAVGKPPARQEARQVPAQQPVATADPKRDWIRQQVTVIGTLRNPGELANWRTHNKNHIDALSEAQFDYINDIANKRLSLISQAPSASLNDAAAHQ